MMLQLLPSSPPVLLAAVDSALVTFSIYILAVLALAWLSNRLAQSKSFLSEYFLGSRGLGVWAFALTIAATSSSGGSFMGFPAKIYTHGWSLAMWIGSYMVVPLFLMGLLGKRINQVARKTGAITVPDVIRDRFESPTFGAMSILLILFFMSVNLIAQFKAGGTILRTLLSKLPEFQRTATGLGEFCNKAHIPIGSEGSPYVLCLLVFAAAVIVYTAYGGFRAVVWTDVMQGIVMIAGVVIMLPLAISQVGGLEAAHEKLAAMTPPIEHTVKLSVATPVDEDFEVPKETWLEQVDESNQTRRVFRVAKNAVIRQGETIAQLRKASEEPQAIPVLEITTPEQRQTLPATQLSHQVRIDIVETKRYAHGKDRAGVYVTGPGPSPGSDLGFLPLSLAICFFFQWAFGNAGQPASMVRMMAFNNTKTLRLSLFTVAIYYSAIYFPLVIIFCCARIILPGWEIEPDRIMPEMARTLTEAAGYPWLAGLLVAAPFAAVMSTVDSFLLMISSAAVRDVYQRNINPQASEKNIKRMTYAVTVTVGVAAMVGALYPPAYLQDIIVYCGSGLTASFLVPVALALYWPRLNTHGAMAGMLGGFLTHLSMYAAGFILNGKFEAIALLGIPMEPILPGLVVSLLAAVTVTLLTAPPPERIVRKFFY